MKHFKSFGLALVLALASGACTGSQAPGAGTGTGGASASGGAGPGGRGSDPVLNVPAVTMQADIHRLNRAEYANTIRDLLGVAFDPAALLVDSSAFGFDHISSVQTSTPGHVEAFLGAADRIVDSLIDLGAPPVTLRYEADSAEVGKFGGQDHRDLIKSVGGGFWQMGGSDELRITLRLPRDGTYQLKVHARPSPKEDQIASTGLPNIDFSLDSELVTSIKVDQPSGTNYSADARLTRGVHTFAVGAHMGGCTTAVLNCGPLVHVQSFEIVGPSEAAEPNSGHSRVFTCTPQAGQEATCAESIVAGFASRAWRKPIEPAQLQRLVGLVTAATAGGAGFNEAVGVALRQVLSSPRFLYRVEAAADPALGYRALDGHELASRLSYFLWSSMPDTELFDLAARASLGTPEVLGAQVARMLADPKAAALEANFAGQWLFSRAIPEVAKDPTWHPQYDAALNADLAEESRLFFDSLLRGGSALDLLTADYAFLNDRLRQYYGLPTTGQTLFERTALSPTLRRGLLGQAGLLSLLAGPKRSSPVDRGKWVLSQLLCESPPPPPPGIPALPLENSDSLTMRDLMVQHRADPGCASCHTLMDPMGFALENFDAAGKWIADYRGQALDVSGLMPASGVAFNGPVELASALANDARLPRCMVTKLFTYATARGPDAFDDAHIDNLTQSFAESNYSLSALISKLVTGPVFTIKRASAAP